MATDPVCGMIVDPARAAGRVEHDGTVYFFCSPGCASKFSANPEKYLAGAREAMTPAPAVIGIGGLKRRPTTTTSAPTTPSAPAAQTPASGVRYTCPMDPDVVSDRPGACPKCGMALEPMIRSAADLAVETNPELDGMTRRFWLAVAFGAPVFAVTMGDMVTGGALVHRLGMTPVNWIALVLSTPVVWWCGWPLFERMWQSFVNRSPNMFTLIGLGVGASYGYSAAATVAGRMDTYFDTAVVIVALVLLGQVLELRARHQTGDAIRQLLRLAPKTARRVNRIHGHETETDVPLDAVIPGDLLRVRPGEKVPVDGVVVEGSAAIDESMITGESIPVAKAPGASVVGSTMAVDGTMVMRAERVGEDTVLARIVRMVSDAQRTRAPIQRLADRVAAVFVPAVVLVAIASFVGWMVWGPEPGPGPALVRAVSVLIIACPCALGLATPMAIMVGTGRGARAGVLIRDAESLERLARIDTLVVDKTGTLTEGRPRVASVEAAGGWTEADLLRLAAAVERGSAHPLAAAIVEAATSRGLSIPPAAGFQSMVGQGVSGRVEKHDVVLGSPTFLAARGIDVSSLLERGDDSRKAGQTVLAIAVDGRLAGFVAAADSVRDSARDAVTSLTGAGVHLVMMTGDNATTAAAVARQLGVNDVRAELKPEDKRAAIRDLQSQGRRVAMAGDGINDAPALAQSDVGVAMGTGTDVAMENAGITLMKGDLRGLVRARRLSSATLTNIKQNLFLAFVYNAIGVPVAAGLLYPLTGWLISPIWASAAMTFSSLSVIANALRLRSLRL
ncbi:MAG TPA: heavy metal translocating P-type ATPase [Vicinamibacterales bacterium]|jgi:Cu+-exporting ATPase